MKKLFTILTISLLPMISFADAEKKGVENVVSTLKGLLENIYGLILAAVGVAFAWGVLKFVFKSGEDQEEGKQMMLWSIVAIFILASVYGIVALFQETTGIKSGDTNIFPTLPIIKSTK